MEGERTPKAFLNSPAAEDSAAFSPDGRWIAYVSDGSGKRQVMVSGFPGPGPFKQVSTAGGNTPVFSPDGRTLFYRQRDQLLEVDFAAEPALHVSAPRVAFDALPGPYDFIGLANFAVNRKGDALLVVKESDPRVVQVITNWFDRLTPAAPPR
jgi:roadblock/LC7 domain-containing protein